MIVGGIIHEEKLDKSTVLRIDKNKVSSSPNKSQNFNENYALYSVKPMGRSGTLWHNLII